MNRHLSRPLTVVASVVVLVLAASLAACSGSEGEAAEPDLSPAASAGKDVAATMGCRSCHSIDGRDGVGPTWKGLYGKEVTLVGGEQVTADEEYLRRAIVDPQAEEVDGYRVTMPKVNLDDDQVEELVAYIRELSPSTGG